MVRKRHAKRRPPPLARRLPWRQLLALSLALGLLAGGQRALDWLLDPHTFPIRRVVVRGALERVTEEDLRGTLEDFLPAGFFTVDLQGMRRALEAHPWVHRAFLRRVWPHTLAVAVAEERPIARWQDGGVVNAQGQRFFPRDIPPHLPLWRGPPHTERVLLGYHRAIEALVRPLGCRVAELRLDARGALSFRIEGGPSVNLGRRAIMERLKRFAEVFPALRARMDLAMVDMRYENGLAARPKGEGG